MLGSFTEKKALSVVRGAVSEGNGETLSEMTTEHPYVRVVQSTSYRVQHDKKIRIRGAQIILNS
jgi:hypothetical protein